MQQKTMLESRLCNGVTINTIQCSLSSRPGFFSWFGHLPVLPYHTTATNWGGCRLKCKAITSTHCLYYITFRGKCCLPSSAYMVSQTSASVSVERERMPLPPRQHGRLIVGILTGDLTIGRKSLFFCQTVKSL